MILEKDHAHQVKIDHETLSHGEKESHKKEGKHNQLAIRLTPSLEFLLEEASQALTKKYTLLMMIVVDSLPKPR